MEKPESKKGGIRAGAAPVVIPGKELPEILACGSDLKNTFCFTRGDSVFIGPNLGDLEITGNFDRFRENIASMEKRSEFKPAAIAHDMHPDFISTLYAGSRPERRVAVQHHHAHVLSCMADNNFFEPVIGVAFDGAGWGPDGTVWGGEFMLAAEGGFARAGHLRPVPMPGGDAAALEPWRMAAGFMYESMETDAAGAVEDIFPGADHAGLMVRAMQRGVNAPRTSSAGRFFDAAAAVIGFHGRVEYEGQAAIELEAACDGGWSGGTFEYRISPSGQAQVYGDPPGVSASLSACRVADTLPAIIQLADELKKGASLPELAARFHSTVAAIIREMCLEIVKDTGVNAVALSGGVFLNDRLKDEASRLLRREGFRVLTHSRVPAGDGGLCVGQALAAAALIDEHD